jgi:hypothetical protein
VSPSAVNGSNTHAEMMLCLCPAQDVYVHSLPYLLCWLTRCTDQFTQKSCRGQNKKIHSSKIHLAGVLFFQRWIFEAKGQRAPSSFIGMMPKSHRPTGALYNLGERKCSSKGASDQIIDQQPTAAVIFNVTSFSPSLSGVVEREGAGAAAWVFIEVAGDVETFTKFIPPPSFI